MLAVLETGAALCQVRIAAVMIHGRGRPAEEMAALGAAIGLEGIRYYCPEAAGLSWYPGRFLEPLDRNEPALSKAVDAIERLLGSLNDQGFPDERIVLGGFSQGACLAAEILVRRPAPHAAALIFTGG